MPQDLRGKLLEWFSVERRDLPWRRTCDPYAVWVSEIMLQQTQVATVTPYYDRWMARFPTVESLASADEQEVLAHWQGLGYYRRCRMLHEGAQFVVAHSMPRSAKAWLDVPGVGRYTAGAISSIALSEAVPLVDGNVERVFARLTGDHSSGKDLHASAWRWAEEMVPAGCPGDWNQALMELGACICKPTSPDCGRCPLAGDCVARSNGWENTLPLKTAKPAIIRLKEIVWMPYMGGSFGLVQIPEGKWWQGMWEFPRTSFDADGALTTLVGEGQLEHAGALVYHVTNHRIAMDVFIHRSRVRSGRLRWIPVADLPSLPMPAPQRKALKLALARIAAPSLMPEGAVSR